VAESSEKQALSDSETFRGSGFIGANTGDSPRSPVSGYLGQLGFRTSQQRKAQLARGRAASRSGADAAGSACDKHQVIFQDHNLVHFRENSGPWKPYSLEISTFRHHGIILRKKSRSASLRLATFFPSLP
jgi:hypothetical protein